MESTLDLLHHPYLESSSFVCDSGMFIDVQNLYITKPLIAWHYEEMQTNQELSWKVEWELILACGNSNKNFEF